jgi:hypothetical protein
MRSWAVRKLFYALLFVIAVLAGCDSSGDKKLPSADIALPKSTAVVGMYPVFAEDTTFIIDPELDSLTARLQTSTLAETKNQLNIPVFIRNFLDTLWNGFSLANYGEPWQEGCTVMPDEPTRELVYFAHNAELALMSYNSGGWGKTNHILIMELENSAVTSYWHGYGNDSLHTEAAIISFLNSNDGIHRKTDHRLSYP